MRADQAVSRRSKTLIAAGLLLATSIGAHAQSFPSYLDETYCGELKMEFVNTIVPSLKKFQTTRYSRDKKVAIRNTKKFLDQRREWLAECHGFLTQTTGRSLFDTPEITDKILETMESLSLEMNFALQDVHFFGDQDPVKREFAEFFGISDVQIDRMELNGELVKR